MKNTSKILTIILCVSTSLTACAKDSIAMRVSATSEYGYIFMTDKTPVSLFSNGEDNIDVISNTNNIYHADTIEDIQAFTSAKNVTLIAEDCPAELYGYPDEDWYMERGINVFWDFGVTGRNTKVAVVDTGIYAEHDVFKDINIAEGANICAYLDRNASKYDDVSDAQGHGTAVASVISQIATGATIVPLRIYDDSSKYSLTAASILAAMQYAISYDIDVINFSAGFSNPSDELIQMAQKLTDELYAKGTLIVSATGNRGDGDNRAEYPASCNGVIGVGAVTKDGDTYIRSPFSTANNSIFVTAPGYGIWCADISGNDMYVQKDGTSFSAPIVAAMAAGVKQADPDINAEKFKELLIKTVTDIDEPGYDTNTGYGLIDFNAMFGAINPVCCIAAAYDSEGVLLETSINSQYKYGDSLPELEKAPDCTVKYLFWDSLNGMRPSRVYNNGGVLQ
ncbi:MAG: S8/S53 family peptidase [Clostridia bacterium]|nr:S8/S53 family peptidase [Clostridia bacterium]